MPETNDTSLITRASQVLALIIALGLTGMVSSILITENIDNSGAKINLAGTLRMQAIRISRARMMGDTPLLEKEITNFQQRLDRIRTFDQGGFDSNQELTYLLEAIKKKWSVIKTSTVSLDGNDNFVTDLDNLVSHFQLESEKNIRLLRLIQYFSLFAVVLIAYITIYRLQNSLINPLKLLVQVATETGHGNFTLRANEKAKGELGLLAKTLNNMSQQLSLKYKDFENRVASKTVELEQTNRSLKILYHSAHELSSREHDDNLSSLLLELEKTLAVGTVSINLINQDKLRHHIETSNNTALRHYFTIEKKTHCFGSLIWETPFDLKPAPWQEQLLKAMANLIATSIDLEHKRHTENRLIIMEERAVIARELHDSLAQSLSYLKLQISVLNKQLQKNLPREQVTPTIDEISQGTNRAYQQLRQLLTTFRLKLDDHSIENSIRETVNEFSEKCDFPITLDYSLENNSLNPHQEIHILQIIREALSNIHNHAHATEAAIRMRLDDNNVQVEINDNGCGLPEKPTHEGHFGLKIMKERAKSLNGTLQIRQNSPQGTRVSLSFGLSLKQSLSI